ncbi:MAG TPA: EAL domain-containing protein [Allosphingosinicella sp.]|jgi:diguanylate cyclase (GGDEF)-like protein/PAS domain S-box-containing protein|nr:EAL domain-containing protein [Allosphingosinicella sp.]
MRHEHPDRIRRGSVPADSADLPLLPLSGRPLAEAAPDGWRSLPGLLAYTPHMLWCCRTDSGEEYYSRQWLDFTGAEGFEEAGGVRRIDLVHPDDRERAEAAWQRSLRTGAPYQCEYRLRHRDGGYRWIRSVGRPERDVSGRVIAWYGSCTDVHDRVVAGEALRESESKFHRILNAMPHIVWSIEADGRRPDYYNRRWYEFTGLPEGSTGGPEWDGLYWAEDVERVAGAWRRSRETGEPYEAEYRLRHHSGEYRWVESRGRAERGADGIVLRWYGTCTDVHDRVLAREAARASERRAQHILDAIPHVIWTADPEGRVDYLSNQWRRFFPKREDLADADRWIGMIHPDDMERVGKAWFHSMATGVPFEQEMRITAGERERWISSRGLPQRDADGRILRWYGTITDVHQGVLAQQALEASERLNRGMIEASPDCVSLLDLDGNVLLANAATQRVYGKSQEELVGGNWTRRVPAYTRETEAALRKARRGGVGRFAAYASPSGEGPARWWDILVAPVPGPDGKPHRIVVMSRDVTEQKAAEEKAQWAANHDCLTDLPNRYLLQKWIDQAVERAAAEGTRFALLLLDIDDFKRINDTVGHDAGDVMLCTFAERLREVLGENAVAGRLGGDEFAALLPDIGTVEEVKETVQRLLDRLAEPCIHGGRILDCRASIGASLFPDDGNRRTDLMKNADMALYAAKAAGRGLLRLYRGEMRMEVQKRTSMLRLARDALKRGSVRPYYQPKVDLRTGRPVGFEALMRWQHPRRGIQVPASVAAAFDDLSLAAAISDRMIESVIEDIVRWRGEGVPFGHVAVNAAAAEFRRGDFAERLLERLAKAGVPNDCFQLEVTETVFVGRGAEYVERALRTLAGEGIAIALDDFGTGFASLSHLKQFPVDIVKIDRSFVCGLEDDPGDAAIVDAVTSLGRRLGKTIVAEGIETSHQHKLLQALGCNQGQGFYYGRPAPASRVPRMASGLARKRHRG